MQSISHHCTFDAKNYLNDCHPPPVAPKLCPIDKTIAASIENEEPQNHQIDQNTLRVNNSHYLIEQLLEIIANQR